MNAKRDYFYICAATSNDSRKTSNVGRVKTNGKRGSAVVLLYEGSAYMRFCDFSWDASIASLTDTAASDQIAFGMLKSPDAAVMTCRTASQLAGDCLAENTLIMKTKLI